MLSKPECTAIIWLAHRTSTFKRKLLWKLSFWGANYTLYCIEYEYRSKKLYFLRWASLRFVNIYYRSQIPRTWRILASKMRYSCLSLIPRKHLAVATSFVMPLLFAIPKCIFLIWMWRVRFLVSAIRMTG